MKKLFTTLILFSAIVGGLSVKAQWQQTNLNVRSVYCFAISGNNIFAGTSNGGVFLSTNNGSSWSASGLNSCNVYALAISGSRIFAGTQISGGVFLSINNGSSWTAVNTGLPEGNDAYVTALAISGSNIFLGNGGHGVYLSSNNGSSWAASGLSGYQPEVFAISGSSIFAGTSNGGVFLSTNNRSSWAAINNGLPKDIYGIYNVPALAISGSNIFAGTMGFGIYLSTNNGSSWAAINNGLPANSDVYALAISGNNILAGTDNGVWKYEPPSNITITNVIPNNSSFHIPKILWTGNIDQTAPPIKICADGSKATHIKYVNKDNTISSNNILFRVKSNYSNYDVDLNGTFSTSDYSISGDTVFVKFTHPQYLQVSGVNRTDTIEVFNYSNGSTIFKIPIVIYRAPVVMVHGVWSSRGETFPTMCVQLISDHYYPQTLLWIADYSATNGLYFDINKEVVPNNINIVLNICRNNNFSAGKVDIIGHSMGGLLARYYLESTAYIEKHDIHKLITINTPHSGSQGANLLTNTTSGVSTAAKIVAEPIVRHFMHSSIYGGAVEDLAVNSNALNTLNGGNGIVPSHAIITQSPVINDGLFYLIFAAVAPITTMTAVSFVNYLFYGDPNDLVVAVPSQSGGLPISATTTFQNQIHMGSPANASVIGEVEIALKTNPNNINNYFCQTGFSPNTISSHYKMAQNTSLLQLQTGSITINYPAQNQNFNPGDLIPINISSSNGINRIILEAINIQSNSSVSDTTLSNGTINYIVPNDAFGSLEFIALGYDPNNLIDYDTVTININQPAALDSILLYGDTIYVQKNKNASVSVTAYFNNGYNNDVSLFSNIQYQIADTNKAKYVGSNLIQGKDTGMTLLTVTYLSKTKNIPVVVIPEDTTTVIATSVNDNQYPNNNLSAKEIENIIIYPNPTNNTITIQYQLNKNINVSVKAFNIYGQQISELLNTNQADGEHKIFFDCNALPSGVYIVEVKTKNGIAVKKFVKE